MPEKRKVREGADVLRLGKKSYVSMRGIEKLCEDIRREGMPAHTSCKTLYRARKASCSQKTPFGPLVVPVSDIIKGTTIAVQNPAAMFYIACQKHGFAQLMRATIADHAPPWKLIVYADGISPADGLAKHDQRKLQAVYYSFAEFGASALCTEEVWFVFLAVREKELRKVNGHLSSFLPILFDRFFVNDESGVNFLTSGIVLPILGSEPFLLTMVFWMALADEPALKDMFACKGHAGLRCCLICRNCSLLRYHDHASTIDVPHTCLDLTRFRKHTGATLRACLAALAAQPAADMSEASLIAGWHHDPQMLALRPYIDVPAMAAFDPMHVYLQGIVPAEFGALMRACSRARSPCSYASIGKCVEQWQWPAHLTAPSAKKLFSPDAAKNNIKSGHFSSGASEMLSLLPVLGLFLQTVALPAGCCVDKVHCFLALIDVVLLVFATDRCDLCPDLLETMILRHLQLVRDVYGELAFLPKHHYSTHFPDMLRKFGWLLRCFVHERHHMLLKKYSQNRVNTRNMEIGLMEDLTIVQLQMISEPWHDVGALHYVQPRHAMWNTLQQMHPGVHARVTRKWRTKRGEVITSGDVCISISAVERTFCEVVVIYEAAGEECAIVYPWELASEQTYTGAVRLLARQSPMRVDIALLDAPLVVSKWERDGIAIAILPIVRRS